MGSLDHGSVHSSFGACQGETRFSAFKYPVQGAEARLLHINPRIHTRAQSIDRDWLRFQRIR
jgi:hypothetical protein